MSNSPRLRTPTVVGQTGMLVRVDGVVAAAVLWELLPYWVRASWAAEVEAVSEANLAAYIGLLASPVALDAAVANERLPASIRAAARERLAARPVTPEQLERLRRHFVALVDRSRKHLLVHLSTGAAADPELDRIDLLGELVAVRGIKADLSSERSLARAFRAMFAARRPWALWAIMALCALAFTATRLVDADDAREVTRALALYPELTRPWTLLTYGWLHLGVGHLVLNLIALALVGHVLEQVLGHLRFVLVYLGCAVGAGLASVLVKTITGVPFWSVGASGAIAGLAGLALFLGLWFQSRYGRIPLYYAGGTLAGGLVLASNILLAATGGDAGADHGAHLGGLALGLAAGYALRRQLADRADRAYGFGGGSRARIDVTA